MKFIEYPSYKEMSVAAANIFISNLRDTLLKKRKANIILSAGETHRLAYEIITEKYSDYLDWSEVNIFHMDEYIEPYEKNLLLQSDKLRNRFVSRLNIKHFFPFKDYSFEEYEKLLKEHLPIDIAFQGIGVNGHYGFNEPITPKNIGARELYLQESTLRNNNIETLEQKAKTIGLNIVKDIEMHIILISGEHKKYAYAKLVELKKFDPSFPISILNEAKNTFVLFSAF